jgi:hypothetical protein
MSENATDGRRHIDVMSRQVCAMSAVSDEPGEHKFTMWEWPCPECDRMLWGWTHGHVQPKPVPYKCPCGSTGMTTEPINVEHCTVENK